jgi:hypothetical protein
MSFLPWVNNVLHTFVWIGLCLGFLYAGARKRPLWEQFLLFSIFSFIVKQAEHEVLGTSELDHFFLIRGNAAYITGWSLMDGLYPIISRLGLRLVARFVSGVEAVYSIPASDDTLQVHRSRSENQTGGGSKGDNRSGRDAASRNQKECHSTTCTVPFEPVAP